MNEILHIYTRVSSTVQEEEGTSLDNQKNLGIKKSEDLGIPYKVWNEGGQSSFHDDLDNRPVLYELLKKIDSGEIRHLFVYNPDRLSRNQITWGTIRYQLMKNGVTLHTVSGNMKLNNPTDDFFLGIMSEVSSYDNKVRAERSRQGRFQKVKMGNWRGGPTPFGYKNVSKKLVIDDFECKWIQKIFKWYSKGLSTNEIRTKLNLNGVLTRRGNTSWSLGSIRKILSNNVYVGYYNYTDHSMNETIRVSSPPIVDQITFDKVQKRRVKLSESKQRTNPTKRFYLLTDLLVCGDCGRKLSGRTNKSSQQNFYYCPKNERDWVNGTSENSSTSGHKCSASRSLNISKTDELVWDTVLQTVRNSYFLKEKFRDNLIPNVIKNRDDGHSTSKRILAKTKKIQKELSDLDSTISRFETDVILKRNSGNPKVIRKNLNDERLKLEGKLEDIRTEHQSFMIENSWVDWMSVFKTDIESKHKLTDQDRKEYLSKLVKKIKVRFDIDMNVHNLEFIFKVPIVNDKLVYNNPEKRSDGWMIEAGHKSLVLSKNLVGTRSKSSKKN